jgi:hypothetical protein
MITCRGKELDSLKRRGAKKTILRASHKLLKQLRCYLPSTHDTSGKEPKVKMRWYIPTTKLNPIFVIVDLGGLLFRDGAYVKVWESPLTDPEVSRTTGVTRIIDEAPLVLKDDLYTVAKVRIVYHH